MKVHIAEQAIQIVSKQAIKILTWHSG